MTVVVTGAAGHIGNNLVRSLVARGESVRVLLLPGPGGTAAPPAERALAGLPVQRVLGDVRDAACVRRLVQGARTVYHLAALISVDEQSDHLLHAVNVEGTRNVVEACRSEAVERLVHMSSVHALAAERAGERPLDEQVPLVEEGTDALPYDLSKARGERVVLAAVERGLSAVIVSPAAVLGPHDYGPSLVAESLLTMQRTPFAVEGAYNWVDVRDVIGGVLAAAERGRAGARYLLSGHRVTVRALMEQLSLLTGGRAPLGTLPTWLLALAEPAVVGYARYKRTRPLYTARALRILKSPCDFRHDRAARELGFTSRPLVDTLRDALHFHSSLARPRLRFDRQQGM
jgi:dihydroflavonol-4-reductase